MKVLELFAGTRSVSKAFEKLGDETYDIEWDRRHPDIDWYADISKVTADDIVRRFGVPDVVWASPPCQSYSVICIGRYRKKGVDGICYPISDFAKESDRLVDHTMDLIEELQMMNPDLIWFIENPRGGLRVSEPVIKRGYNKYRHTVTYCQYGDTRMKPTDIWTNLSNPLFKPPCRNGDPCHERSPRGSKNGTKKLKNAIERSRIPEQLCDHIAKVCHDCNAGFFPPLIKEVKE